MADDSRAAQIHGTPITFVMPDMVYCPACGQTTKTEGTTNEFAVFVGCSCCHRLIRVIYSDGDVSEVTA